jgi:hypothetical protein
MQTKWMLAAWSASSMEMAATENWRRSNMAVHAISIKSERPNAVAAKFAECDCFRCRLVHTVVDAADEQDKIAAALPRGRVD